MRRFSLAVGLVPLLFACLFACSSSATKTLGGSDAGPLQADVGAAVDGTADGGTTPIPGQDASLPANPTDGGLSFTIDWGSVTAPPGTEHTKCVVKRLGNPDRLHVGAIHNQLGTTSHHMIVYRVADTTEQPDPFDCRPFTDTLDPSKGTTIMVSQKKDDLLTFPNGVGYTLDPMQMIRLELHYINATRQSAQSTASATFIGLDDASYQHEADFLFIGNLDVNVPAMSMTTLGPTYFKLPLVYASANFFAITGHEHKLGTNVQIGVAAAKTSTVPDFPIYDVPNWLWSEPATVIHDPPFTVPPGGGFRFTCQWTNTTTAAVRFGESANDEMCFFWAYYYPSKGAKVCFHTDQVPGGYDFCCPGDQACQLIL